MEKEKVVVFLDYANINRAAREKRYRLDYHDLLQYVGEERFLIDAHCYIPINPRNEHRLDREIQELWRSGYIVTTKVGTIAGGTYKCNFDVEITMDILKVVYQMKPDIIVLATGDSDFVSLIQEVRKSGVRVEVAAFEETAGTDIMSKCSGFIDLAVYYEGYLAAQNGEQGEDSIAEQYRDLIQSQQGEQGEDGIAEKDHDLIQPQGSNLKEDDVKLPVDQVDKQTRVPAPDIIDELDL
ncbi:MAG TPA: NYN domain-containing protein [Ktedonobacteraceae bacterium]|nr:NYN domain-containing protein [Ktedonobacteraceae bacterium]